MRPIRYPNPLTDLVVVEFRSPQRIGFMVRPQTAGTYRLFVWPKGLPEPKLALHTLLRFPTADSPPLHPNFTFPSHTVQDFTEWQWVLMHTKDGASALEDLAAATFGIDTVAKGNFSILRYLTDDEIRIVVWSCHMPYETGLGNQATIGEHSQAILEWFNMQIQEFKPHIVWGAGDTAYSDGTEATDFSNQVYGQGDWFRNPLHVAWLRKEYRKMYRYFWSFKPLAHMMQNIPHLFIWDDHEIHDGWGSEGKDFEPGNQALFKEASKVANEYILNAGPRIRSSGEEAHQAFIFGPLAAFIFDTRSKRNYEARGERLISRQQYSDFVAFLVAVARDVNVTHLITCTTVPFVNMRTWVLELVSRAPNLLNDTLLQGVRDDVRDSWTSPGNIDTLIAVLDALVNFTYRRPDVRVINVSGDIHVANAYEIWHPGALQSIYQVTTSAITNRTHPGKIVEELTEIDDGSYIQGVGQVRRVWPTITDPNVLFMRVRSQGTEFRLKIFNENSVQDDLVLRV